MIALFSGCTAGVFEVDIPFPGSKVVMNGFVSPDGTELQLTRSVNPNDTAHYDAIHPITSAQVALQFVDGQVEFLAESAPGIYTSPLSVASGTELSIKVLPDPSNEDIEITIPAISVPEDVESISFTVGNVDTSGGLSSKLYQFTATIDIEKSSLDQQPYIGLFATDGPDVVSSFLGSSLILAEDITSACGFVQGGWLVFPTYCYGGVKSFSLQVEYYVRVEYDPNTGQINEGLPFDLNITAAVIQPEIYDQIKSTTNSNSQFDQIFSVPNLYSSNVEGGLGVVGGAIFREFTVRLE